MERAPDDMHTPFRPQSRGRSFGGVALTLVGCGALFLGACGGGDDDDDSAESTVPSTTVAVAPSPTSTTAPEITTTTSTTTIPPIDYVTEGATVVVANASGINGAAGRMSDTLAQVGFTMGAATNSSEGQLETTKIYYDPANENAQPVADSLREGLGGGDIEVLELAVPAPTNDGEIGDATVLVAMGNDTADKSLDELQGRVAPTGATEEATEESGDEATTEEVTGEEVTGDEATGDEATGDG